MCVKWEYFSISCSPLTFDLIDFPWDDRSVLQIGSLSLFDCDTNPDSYLTEKWLAADFVGQI